MRTLRFIGMAVLAIVVSFGITACSSDDDEDISDVLLSYTENDTTSESEATSSSSTSDATASDTTTPHTKQIGNYYGVQLWAGGPYWATCNVGASSATEYGDLFYWGALAPIYNRSGSTYKNSSTSFYTGTSSIQGKTSYDVATAEWGSSWMTPTSTQLGYLINSTYCSYEMTTINGVYGLKVTGNTDDYKNDYIFLPAAGRYYGDSSFLNRVGSQGCYWSATPKESGNWYFLSFNSASQDVGNTNVEESGFSVRPIAQ